MIQNVNIGQYETQKAYVHANKQNNIAQNHQSPTFGYYEEERPTHPIKKLALSLVNDAFGLVGVNLVLWKVQSFVNGDILSGKINKHFTKGITDNEKVKTLAEEMKTAKHLDKVKMHIGESGTEGQAFFNHEKNIVVVGKQEASAVFHELGHAIIENNTKFLRKLQRGRNHYSWIALGLYTMIAQREKNPYDDKRPGPITKMKNFLNKNDYVIPLIAFSPELITEFKASQYGLKFLKGKVKDGAIEKSLFNKIKKSYITCFLTYLFIPVSIMLVDALRNSVDKKVRKYN